MYVHPQVKAFSHHFSNTRPPWLDDDVTFCCCQWGLPPECILQTVHEVGHGTCICLEVMRLFTVGQSNCQALVMNTNLRTTLLTSMTTFSLLRLILGLPKGRKIFVEIGQMIQYYTKKTISKVKTWEKEFFFNHVKKRATPSPATGAKWCSCVVMKHQIMWHKAIQLSLL